MTNKIFKIKTVASALAALATTSAVLPAGAVVPSNENPTSNTLPSDLTATGVASGSNLIIESGEHLLGFTIGTRADGSQFAQHDSHASHSSHSSHSSHHSSSF